MSYILGDIGLHKNKALISRVTPESYMWLNTGFHAASKACIKIIKNKSDFGGGGYDII